MRPFCRAAQRLLADNALLPSLARIVLGNRCNTASQEAPAGTPEHVKYCAKPINIHPI